MHVGVFLLALLELCQCLENIGKDGSKFLGRIKQRIEWRFLGVFLGGVSGGRKRSKSETK